MENLAAIYQATGKSREAEDLLRESVAIWEENMGKDHPSTAQAYFNLGTLLFAHDKHEESEEMLWRYRRIMVGQRGGGNYADCTHSGKQQRAT
jgi:tetratricopeptide (TPR) repeat protein